MNLHNLAIVFGPTLFQTDGQDYTAGQAIEDLIQHYTLIFEVSQSVTQQDDIRWQTLHFYSHFLNAYTKMDSLLQIKSISPDQDFRLRLKKLQYAL